MELVDIGRFACKHGCNLTERHQAIAPFYPDGYLSAEELFLLVSASAFDLLYLGAPRYVVQAAIIMAQFYWDNLADKWGLKPVPTDEPLKRVRFNKCKSCTSFVSFNGFYFCWDKKAGLVFPCKYMVLCPMEEYPGADFKKPPIHAEGGTQIYELFKKKGGKRKK